MADLPRYPDTTGKDLTTRVNDLEDYIINLHRYIRYALENIDTSNMTQGATGQFLKIQGLYTTVNADETGLVSRMTNAENDVSEVKQDVNGLTSTVSNVSGDLSSLSQTVDDITLTVKKNDGTTSSVVLSSGTLNLQDLVFSVLGSSGATVINGGNITTGSINADRISGGTISSSVFKSIEPGGTFGINIDDSVIEWKSTSEGMANYAKLVYASGSGFSIMADDMNIIGSDVRINDADPIKPQSFIELYGSASQTITASTLTKINFNTIFQENDPSSILSLYSNGVRCAKAGEVMVWCSVDFIGSSSSTISDGYIIMYKNGSVLNVYTRRLVYQNKGMSFDFVPLIIDVAANDYIQFYINAPAGTINSGFPTRMGLKYIS